MGLLFKNHSFTSQKARQDAAVLMSSLLYIKSRITGWGHALITLDILEKENSYLSFPQLHSNDKPERKNDSMHFEQRRLEI